MMESEIRPDELYDETMRLRKIDTEKILLKSKSFVKVCCPACNKVEYELFYKRDGFTFVKCSVCETVFVNPRPTKEMLFEHYATSLNTKFWKKNVYPKSEESRIKHLILPRVKKILELCDKYDVPTCSIMDVGAGFGTFCEQITKTGKFKEVIAVEPNLEKDKYSHKKGITVIQDFIENIAERKVNVITSFESIEHMFSPKEYLNSVSKMLAKGGLLFLTTPNIKGFDLNVLKDKSDSTMAPGHINYFHPKSISLLLENCGFEVLSIETPGKLDAELVRKKALAGVISLDSQPFLKCVLIDEWQTYMDSFQQWLASNGLSSSMSITARKR